MRISEVYIDLIRPRDGLIGFASLVVIDGILLSSIGIHKRLDGCGYRLTYPTKSVQSGDRPIFHPIRREIGREFETAIEDKLKEVMNKHDRHRSSGYKLAGV